MRRTLLDLKPKSVICPYCGRKHEWGNGSLKEEKKFFCQEFGEKSSYKICCDEDFLHLYIDADCKNATYEEKVALENAKEISNSPIVKFEEKIGSSQKSFEKCDVCKNKKSCKYITVKSGGKYSIWLNLGFEFERSEFDEKMGNHTVVKNVSGSPVYFEQEVSRLVDYYCNERGYRIVSMSNLVEGIEFTKFHKQTSGGAYRDGSVTSHSIILSQTFIFVKE